MKLGILGLLILTATSAFATTPRLLQFDEFQNLSGGSVIPMPSVGSNLVTDSNTLTLTNKTLTSPILNGPVISGSTTLTDALLIENTSDATKQLQFSLSGNTTGKKLTISTSQSNSETIAVPNVGTGDSFATLLSTQTFGSGSTWNGAEIGVAYGGTGAGTLTQYGVLMGNGTSPVSAIGPSSNSGYVLTSTGASSAPTFQAPPSGAPTVNNSAASPQSVSASGITLSTPTYSNIVFIAGSSSGNTTVTATPSITACTAAGQTLTIVSASSTNFVTLQNNADLSGSQLLLNGPWTSGENSGTPYVLNMTCNGAVTPSWVETSRNN